MPRADYNIFISWSGERSRHVATALRDWIPMVIQAAIPFMSDVDIEAGSRSLNEIARALEGVRLGISCLTPENLNSAWLLYEGGALSKTVDDTMRLCTLLLGGLRPEDVKGPLGMFQATRPEKSSTRKLIGSINNAVSKTPMPDSRLDRVFDGLWPNLEESLRTLPTAPRVAEPRRSADDMVAEILEIVRAILNGRKKVDWMDDYLPTLKEFFPLLQQIVQKAKQAGVGTPQEALKGPNALAPPQPPG